mmetsp:Transcript_1311/g.2349  ORF Transcript_1311/g.2349 Transcript_1311/m.2349 type:complete len:206 (-) Transcript_1311:2024-2641(-)
MCVSILKKTPFIRAPIWFVMLMTALIANVSPMSSGNVEKVKLARNRDSTSSSVKTSAGVGVGGAVFLDGEGAVVRAGGVGVVGRSPRGLTVGATVVGVQVSPPLMSSSPLPSSSSPVSPSMPGIQSASTGVGATVVATQVAPPLPGVLLPRADLVLTATRSSVEASAKGGVSPPVSSGGATSARVDLKEVTMTLCAVNLNARRSP